MKVSKQRLVEIIKEELERDALDERVLGLPTNQMTHFTAPSTYDSQKDDINRLVDMEDGDTESVYNNLQIASRILEDIPFEYLENRHCSELLSDAVRLIRTAMDKMATDLERSERDMI